MRPSEKRHTHLSEMKYSSEDGRLAGFSDL
jgi:hypothetical protein